jgi:hypothetical protein
VNPAVTLARRLRGDYVVDPWGADEGLIDAVNATVERVWRISIDGELAVAPGTPAVLVANRRFGVAEPLVLARALFSMTGRRPRFLGLPDVAPVGWQLRRLGVAVDHAGELASLLRAGHLVSVPLSWYWRRPPRAGNLAPDVMAPALAQRVPVVPVAVLGGELSGRWRVFVGEPLPEPRTRGPLALAELADGARAGVQALLDEASPPRWLIG